MFFDFKVPVRRCSGKDNQEKKGASVHVEYQYGRVYHPEKKYNVPKLWNTRESWQQCPPKEEAQEAGRPNSTDHATKSRSEDRTGHQGAEQCTAWMGRILRKKFHEGISQKADGMGKKTHPPISVETVEERQEPETPPEATWGGRMATGQVEAWKQHILEDGWRHGLSHTK